MLICVDLDGTLLDTVPANGAGGVGLYRDR